MATTNLCRKRWLAIRGELTRDKLPTRVFKCVLATTLTVIISLLPNIRNVYGTATYLASITTVFVFGHPGRRLGSMRWYLHHLVR
ncbi:hypothetical protein B9Z19DRAFT_751197 [Tuber borchii]|uniref:Uncharacterized protein n=1 Tax=Tuber borchii TaxID=42251 RepID=A0A2T7A7R7_TUBBO|nr:hypothetical protein B9Z19DRAFT_751197 [Tuber borchii]